MIVFTVRTEEREKGIGSAKDVYRWLVERQGVPHIEAADAADWCELASVGEWYENDYCNIEVVELKET